MENIDDVDRLDIQYILEIVQNYLNQNPNVDELSGNMALQEEIYIRMKEFRERKHA